LLSATLASAGTITQTETYSGTPNFTQTLTFDEFDDLGGTLTLTSIQVLVDLDVLGGVLVLDNDGVDPASGTYEFGGKADISSTDVSLLDAAFQPVTAEVEALTSGAFNLTGNVGDGANDFDPSAPDGVQVNGTTQSDSDSGFIAAALFSQYIGTSTFDVDLDATQWSDFGGVSGIEWAVTPVTADGEVTVIYNYVPEPATMGLLSLSGMALLRRRRK
jgi:hypothetical protein